MVYQAKKKRRISKNRNYKRGRNFEYRVKRFFENRGYWVIRSYASKGAADLHCIKPMPHIGSEVIHVQCKGYSLKRLPEIERRALITLAKLTGGTPILVSKDEKTRKLVFVSI